MLIGISLGPGDPKLMTFKAADALKTSIKVFVPGEMAADLAKPYCSPEVLDFPMIEDAKKLEEIWSMNADIVAAYAEKGPTGFACIGDVNTFSTFSHLKRAVLQRHPGIETKTIPGVGIVPALASRFDIALDGSFEVSDGSEVNSIIRMKATRPRKIADDLRKRGFNDFMLGVKLCTADERTICDDMPEKSDYFSVLLARRRK